MDFEEEFCVRCKHDAKFWQTSKAEDGCEIHRRALAHGTGEAEYPKEWTHDSEGQPICTAFEEEKP
jgi:hypothetical protein